MSVVAINNQGKKILIAPDKFKGSLSAAEICYILKNELTKGYLGMEVDICPLADGGDGSVEILANYLSLDKEICDTVDPLRRPIVADYYRSADAAYIELAGASGLVLLNNDERNPFYTSTYGTGLLIKDALDKGLKNINLFLGGSATNDGGIGIANALGILFYGKNGDLLSSIGESLKSIRTIIPTIDYHGLNITLYCDVDNVPYGSTGAAHTYGSQKGASIEEIHDLDNGIANLCNKIEEMNGINLTNLKGGGAAGAVAVSLVGLLGANITSGLAFITKAVDLENKIAESDMVITGEGCLDDQSLNGKVISGVADLCKKYNKELVLVVGQNRLDESEIKNLGASRVFCISDKAQNLKDAMTNGHYILQDIGRDIAKIYGE